MSETYVLSEILKELRKQTALLKQIEKNTNPPPPQTASIGFDFSPPTPKE